MKNLSLYSLCVCGVCFFSVSSAEILRDPTQPSNAPILKGAALSNTALSLQSIIKTEKQYKAIISKQVYKPGDVIGEFRVLTINANSVLLANDDKQIKLELYDYEIKK
ncbi:agglutinin biogenesis protein MshK [Pseudoalteromonas agarivorans]|uniref:MSHA biogenesis protein MshK n=1 Tax=Pseudoalteromonas agarivorans DSM 14585 TaxID=1312369 RepID=A0ACA8DS83_9GAMM|nr:agglutinin biogenesis protein MshK [Pseudoalteromonas agarivorans]ATC80980.1 MSHA biogenesis protein MshK [Pseudoalteromonas agarivorans DSM 14585]